ncbi:MAG: DNA polymerase I [Bacilli bacterium]|nr:DNA polymerase I [Bacilli bacterium]
MKKIILVDGNNLLFRSYYATAYSGSLMKNSKGFPTNALYGFTNMIQKIIAEENPEYMAVAFDIGKNFRAEKYAFYKDGRKETPEDLKKQMPYARKILKGMGVPYFELAPYEADDIIGTLAKMVEEDPEFIGTIVSSDRDLLQLVSNQLDMKLLKQKGFIRYNPESFYEEYQIEPIKIIDLKALAGDSSDNIPGVKGIGEKTALSLLQEYQTLEGIYENLESIKGKKKELLKEDQQMAFISKEIATIYRDVPLMVQDLEDIRYQKQESEELTDLFKELEFYSLLNKFEIKKEEIKNDFKIVKNIEDLMVCDINSFYIELDGTNYHIANIIGMAISNISGTFYIPNSLIKEAIYKIQDTILYTFDFKKNIVALNRLGINIEKVQDDMMILAYLLNYNIKDDVAYLMSPKGYQVAFYDTLKKDDWLESKRAADISLKSKFLFEERDNYILEIKREMMYDLYRNIEMPLISVLANMEMAGIKVDKSILEEMKHETKVKVELLECDIFNLAGETFNISSPKQLGDILFEKLGLPGGKKNKTGYKTDVKILHKLLGVHPIIEKILEYRNLTKLISTYLEGLGNYIHDDGKIHTIYKQNLTRTGRLSSVEPNLQNIPVRDEEGRKIRKAFFPEFDEFLSADYSQIELRILAHISNSNELIEAFIKDDDIHTKVASDIYDVPINAVSKKMRSTAKAVIFGIVYGISGFGLGENLEISRAEATNFINKYYELYPGVKRYMDEIVKEAYQEGSVRTLFKRKRIIDELNNSNYMIRQSGERIALNTPIQGTSADIIKKAMVEIAQKLKEEKVESRMLLQVHDELIFDIKKEEKEKVTQIVTETMTKTIELKVPLKVSADFGANWYETK